MLHISIVGLDMFERSGKIAASVQAGLFYNTDALFDSLIPRLEQTGIGPWRLRTILLLPLNSRSWKRDGLSTWSVPLG